MCDYMFSGVIVFLTDVFFFFYNVLKAALEGNPS